MIEKAEQARSSTLVTQIHKLLAPEKSSSDIVSPSFMTLPHTRIKKVLDPQWLESSPQPEVEIPNQIHPRCQLSNCSDCGLGTVVCSDRKFDFWGIAWARSSHLLWYNDTAKYNCAYCNILTATYCQQFFRYPIGHRPCSYTDVYPMPKPVQGIQQRIQSIVHQKQGYIVKHRLKPLEFT